MKRKTPRIKERDMSTDSSLMIAIDDMGVTFIEAGPLTRGLCEHVWASLIKRGVIV